MVAAADGRRCRLASTVLLLTPLVSVQGGKTYVYFTVNSADSKDYVNYSAGGGVYCIRSAMQRRRRFMMGWPLPVL